MELDGLANVYNNNEPTTREMTTPKTVHTPQTEGTPDVVLGGFENASGTVRNGTGWIGVLG